MEKIRNRIFRLSLFSFLFFIIFISQNTYQKVYAEAGWEKTTLDAVHMEVVEASPWGILAGEFDDRVFINPPPENAMYISRDLGQTWEILGLENRSVLDIKYFDGKIYATTYYVRDNTLGLFVSNDKGETWNRIGPMYSPTKVDRDDKTIYLGSIHAGLWISKDEGQTWVQKMGSGVDGTTIHEIESSENITLVRKENVVYKTTDNGDTWSEITDLYLKGILSFCINGNVIFAGSSGTPGLFLSTDTGNTWRWVSEFGNYGVQKIIYFDGRYYAGGYNPEKQSYTVYYTPDLGNTWTDTELYTTTPAKTLSLAGIFSDPSYLFAVVVNKGVYKYQIPKNQFSQFSFLDIPWNYENENELTDKITSYFDHSYPLLGYSYFSEPEDENESTLNFLGIKNVVPYIYYSSHSGTDFGLKYGTEILAPAPGFATYYYCKDCGNSIKIDHLNGYQTTYMHLQDEDLVTKNDKIWVNKDDIIGKVGLTGRTTGPHLHFEVTKDKSFDGIFSNDFPMGRVDPFGWQTFEKEDPWKIFSWEDSLGNHTGTESSYLWNNENLKSSKIISGNENPDGNKIINLENKRIEFENPSNLFTAKIFSYIQPALDYPTKISQYVENTSFILEALDQLGNKIINFENPINISVDINPIQLENVNLKSIKLYFWNEVLKVWEIIPSFFDLQSNKLTAQTNHLSWFAVFGEKVDKNPPETEVLVSGSQNNGWFTEFPLIEFSFYNGEDTNIENTFYSIDSGDTWETYTEPFYVQKDGITNLIFKSQDTNGNMEDEKNFVLHVNLYERKIEKKGVRNSEFRIQSEATP